MWVNDADDRNWVTHNCVGACGLICADGRESALSEYKVGLLLCVAFELGWVELLLSVDRSRLVRSLLNADDARTRMSLNSRSSARHLLHILTRVSPPLNDSSTQSKCSFTHSFGIFRSRPHTLKRKVRIAIFFFFYIFFSRVSYKF